MEVSWKSEEVLLIVNFTSSANNGKEEKNGFNVFNCRGTRQENT